MNYSHLHRCPASYNTGCDHTQSDTLQAQLLPTNSPYFSLTLSYISTTHSNSFKLTNGCLPAYKDIASLTTHSNTFKLTNEIHNSRPAYTKTKTRTLLLININMWFPTNCQAYLKITTDNPTLSLSLSGINTSYLISSINTYSLTNSQPNNL